MLHETTRGILKGTYYTTFTAGGMLLADQLARSTEIVKAATGLETMIHEGITMLGANPTLAHQGLNVIEALVAVKGIMKVRDYVKSRFRKNQWQKREETQKGNISTKITRSQLPAKFGHALEYSAYAVAAGSLLLGSFETFQSLWQSAGQTAHQMAALSDKVLPYYNWLLGTSGPIAIPIIAKSIAGIALTNGAVALQETISGNTHGPAIKEYHIDGYSAVGKYLSTTNIGQSLRRFFTRKVKAHLSRDMRLEAGITTYDYRTKEWHNDGSIGLHLGLEPGSQKQNITSQEITDVVASLQKCKGEKKIFGKDVEELAKKGQLYTQFKDTMSPTTWHIIMQAVTANPEEEITSLGDADLLQRVQHSPFLQNGGLFQRTYYKANDGKEIPVMSLTERIGSTIKSSQEEYQQGFAKKGKLIPVLAFRSVSQAALSDNDAGQDHHDNSHDSTHDMPLVNYIKQVPKGLYNLGTTGFGDWYAIMFGEDLYYYEERFVASDGPLMEIIPGIANKHNRPARTGYIRDQHNKIVAQIEDTSYFSKLLGNYNAKVTIYDEKLADTATFGRLCTLFSRWLTREHEYRSNRLKNLHVQASADLAVVM